MNVEEVLMIIIGLLSLIIFYKIMNGSLVEGAEDGSPTVECNPFARPPQMCPGGIPCPDCGAELGYHYSNCACPTTPLPPTPPPPTPPPPTPPPPTPNPWGPPPPPPGTVECNPFAQHPAQMCPDGSPCPDCGAELGYHYTSCACPTTSLPPTPPPADDVPEYIKEACGEGGDKVSCKKACEEKPDKSCCYGISKGMANTTVNSCNKVCPLGDKKDGELTDQECCNLELLEDGSDVSQNINDQIKYNCSYGCMKGTIPMNDCCSDDDRYSMPYGEDGTCKDACMRSPRANSENCCKDVNSGSNGLARCKGYCTKNSVSKNEKDKDVCRQFT